MRMLPSGPCRESLERIGVMGVTVRSQLCECCRAIEDRAAHEKRGPEGPRSYLHVVGFTRVYPISEIRERKVSRYTFHTRELLR